MEIFEYVEKLPLRWMAVCKCKIWVEHFYLLHHTCQLNARCNIRSNSYSFYFNFYYKGDFNSKWLKYNSRFRIDGFYISSHWGKKKATFFSSAIFDFRIVEKHFILRENLNKKSFWKIDSVSFFQLWRLNKFKHLIKKFLKIKLSLHIFPQQWTDMKELLFPMC